MYNPEGRFFSSSVRATGNLDSSNSEIAENILHDLSHEKGHTVIIVTHDNDFAMRAVRVLELVDGRIVTAAN